MSQGQVAGLVDLEDPVELAGVEDPEDLEAMALLDAGGNRLGLLPLRWCHLFRHPTLGTRLDESDPISGYTGRSDWSAGRYRW